MLFRANKKLIYKGLIVWISLFCSAGLEAQKRDTLDIYKKIKKVAYKRKATALLYDAIFVSPVPQQYEKKTLSKEQIIKDPNAVYSGKIIRKIVIIVYDPFGYSVNDTFTRAINDLQRIGNRIHITSRHRVIRNLLMFENGDSVELFRITESERLLRSMRFVNDARIILSGTRKSDSVDVMVKVQDKWSMDVSADGSPTGGYLRFRDRNISGWGQTYEQRVGFYKSTGYDYRGNYNIANIKNTYISSDLHYATTKAETSTGIAFNRPFYSPLTRWAGGVAGNRVWGRYNYTDSIEKHTPLNLYNYDLWLARSFALGNEKKTEKNSNIILSARYAATHYLTRPSFTIDTNRMNVHTQLYLGSVGYSVRRYYKDMFIYRFGANEDIPEGLLMTTSYGIIKKESVGKLNYSGFEISNGRHFKDIGYFSVNLSYGSFYGAGYKTNSTIISGANYFSDLYKNRKWYFRHFIYYKLVHGLNKETYENVTLKPGEMYGFNSGNFSGKGKMILNFETVSYAPYNLIGFKFAPVLSIAFGMVETPTTKFRAGQVYQAYSLGLLIRNENLVNATFEMNVGFYPLMPEDRRDVFKLNPVGSFSLKLRSFDVSKPGTVAFE